MQYDLSRFIEAQESEYWGYSIALREIKNGRKDSHWIWYIFPQFREFGHSSMAVHYGLADVNEAREYLSHPVLGSRLREISNALLEHSGKDIVDILGELDAKKTRSCMTLFDYLSPNDVFGKVLDTFYKGQRGGRTLKTIQRFQEESCQ